jgi:catechol 2,3-dioxygenase-like lactoylglutathione lyase family enzyme
MANEITIPALPCASINDTLAFYVALGFDITYQQTRPNTYGCVKRGDIELHFFAMKGVDPANSYSTCLVLVADADALYQSFAEGLRQHYGKLPVAGIPRITKPNHKNAAGDYRFNVIDPGGNYIRFIQLAEKSNRAELPVVEKTPLTRLGRAVKSAELTANSKGDFAAAAKILDTALAQSETAESPTQHVQALALRAEIAVNLGDQPRAKKLIHEIHQFALNEHERNALADALQQAEQLALMLQ